MEGVQGTVWHVTSDRVKKLRSRFDLTQEQVADRGGLKRTEVVKIESGSNVSGTEFIQQVAVKKRGIAVQGLRRTAEARH